MKIAFIISSLGSGGAERVLSLIANELDEKNGILVENKNIDELAKNLQNLIDNKKLRDKLSKEAIKVREKYDIKKIANEWEKVIKEVVDE